MMYYTHAAFGLLISLMALYLLEINSVFLFIATALLFSLLPDIDETKSAIGRSNKIISSILNFSFGHRGILHSIYIPLILFFIFNFINNDIAFGILIGYFSHLFADSLTKSGIRPLYPIINKKISGFLKTNSMLEKIFFVSLITIILYFSLKYI